MSEWIQTIKRLPASQYVVAWNGRQFFAAFANECGEFIEAGSNGELLAGVTHWMPFPLAPDGFAYRRAPKDNESGVWGITREYFEKVHP